MFNERNRVKRGILAVLVLSLFSLAPLALAQEASFDDELSGIMSDFEALKEELALAQAGYKSLREECAVKAKDYDFRLNRLQGERDSLKNKLNELESEKIIMASEGRNFSNSIQQLTGSLQEKEKAISELKVAQEKLLNKQEESAV
ncbi:MAG: hypothetical protein Q7J72_07730, partial [Candidatus Omnitrophota bacterium]|nr:hypothetical protein [Candidatus Omnitrophota bacterium]